MKSTTQATENPKPKKKTIRERLNKFFVGESPEQQLDNIIDLAKKGNYKPHKLDNLFSSYEFKGEMAAADHVDRQKAMADAQKQFFKDLKSKIDLITDDKEKELAFKVIDHWTENRSKEEKTHWETIKNEKTTKQPIKQKESQIQEAIPVKAVSDQKATPNKVASDIQKPAPVENASISSSKSTSSSSLKDSKNEKQTIESTKPDQKTFIGRLWKNLTPKSREEQRAKDINIVIESAKQGRYSPSKLDNLFSSYHFEGQMAAEDHLLTKDRQKAMADAQKQFFKDLEIKIDSIQNPIEQAKARHVIEAWSSTSQYKEEIKELKLNEQPIKQKEPQIQEAVPVKEVSDIQKATPNKVASDIQKPAPVENASISSSRSTSSSSLKDPKNEKQTIETPKPKKKTMLEKFNKHVFGESREQKIDNIIDLAKEGKYKPHNLDRLYAEFSLDALKEGHNQPPEKKVAKKQFFEVLKSKIDAIENPQEKANAQAVVKDWAAKTENADEIKN